MKILIARHGQSMTNIDADIGARFRVNLDNNVLTLEGIEQAVTLGKKLRDDDAYDVHQIVASPLSRTKQTAFCIASALSNCVPIRFDNRFREIEWDVGGEFDRLENYIPDFDSRKLAIDHRPMIHHRRGAFTLESQLDVYNRVVPAFVETVRAHVEKHTDGSDLLIVTHFFVVRAMEAFVHHGAPEAMLQYSPKNTKLIEYSVDQVLGRACPELVVA